MVALDVKLSRFAKLRNRFLLRFLRVKGLPWWHQAPKVIEDANRVERVGAKSAELQRINAAPDRWSGLRSGSYRTDLVEEQPNSRLEIGTARIEALAHSADRPMQRSRAGVEGQLRAERGHTLVQAPVA